MPMIDVYATAGMERSQIAELAAERPTTSES